MMNLDEAIKHCEEVMMENLEKTKDRNASDPIAKNCFECADEHRQLAEWLKELKAYREKLNCTDCIIDGTDACSRGAGRAVDDEICGDFIPSSSEIPNTCGDAISRKHLLEEIAMLKKSPWFNENTYGSKVIRKEAVEIVEDVCIKREPSVTPQQRTGRWKFIVYDANCIGHYECSECHWNVLMNVSAYCPHCGTKMEVDS